MTNPTPEFPDDENGAVLRQLWDQGDPLTEAREFDFGAEFEDEDNALQYAVALLQQEFKVELTAPDEENPRYLVSCYPVMLPSHADIGDLEGVLKEAIEHFEGEYVGWDCWLLRTEH